MCNCGLKANSQSVINGAYMTIQFTSEVTAYTGIVTGRVYGDYSIGETLTINLADFDGLVMTQI